MLERKTFVGLEFTVNDNLLQEVELVKENGLLYLRIKLMLCRIKYACACYTNRELPSANFKILLREIIV